MSSTFLSQQSFLLLLPARSRRGSHLFETEELARNRFESALLRRVLFAEKIVFFFSSPTPELTR